MKKNKKWWIFFLCVALFLILSCLVVLKTTTHIDKTVYQFLHLFENDMLTTCFKWITELGYIPGILVLLLVILVVFRNYRFAYILPIHAGVIVVFNILLKSIFVRPRPLFPHLVEVTGFSFPSGHSMVTMAVYGYLIYLVHHYIKNRTYRDLLNIFLGLIILAVGLSRIYLGVHYFTDVLAGFSVSICYLMVATHLPIFKLEED